MKHWKKSKLVIGILVVICVVAGCILLKDFDASGYVEAILEQHFKGNVKKASEIIKGDSKAELEAQYEKGIEQFVEDTLTSGIVLDSSLHEQYIVTCKNIFKSMKYEVKESKKVNKKEYHVTVEYEPVDLFLIFQAAVKQDSQTLIEKANNGEYQGTKEEITQQMQMDFVNNAYKLLEQSYQTMTYGKKETTVFKVTSQDGKKFSLDETALSQFIVDILRLDEIQD
ncbi:hypothetical protein ACTQ6A_05755 [Lachnospiraceae bacterium LCP25S3_G4]